MPVVIVDFFQIVDVGKKYRDRQSGVLAALEQSASLVHETASVHNAGQLIDVRDFRQADVLLMRLVEIILEQIACRSEL